MCNLIQFIIKYIFNKKNNNLFLNVIIFYFYLKIFKLYLLFDK